MWHTLAIIGTIIISTASVLGVYFDSQAAQDRKINSLCIAYGQTVSRIDQNLVNIGEALHVAIVDGIAGDNNPCQN